MVCRCARHQDTTRIARAVLEEAGLVAPVSEEREMDRLARECIARSLPPADMGREHYPLEIDRDWTRS